MEQWTDSISVWTTRSADEWMGDGSATASPISLSCHVSEAFAGTLSNVYQQELLQARTDLKAASVSVDSEIQADVLSVGVELTQADMVIDTQCHVSTVTLKATLGAHKGNRVSIAYQTVKPHAQITPKNPIVFSNVTLNPESLSLSVEIAGTVYAGYYTEIAPEPLTMTSFMYPGGVVVSTNYQQEAALPSSLNLFGPAIDVSPTVNVASAQGLSITRKQPTIVATCSVAVEAIPITLDFPGFEYVATGYAAQDDLPIRFDLKHAQVWHDNNAKPDAAAATLNVSSVIVAEGASASPGVAEISASVNSVDFTIINVKHADAHPGVLTLNVVTIPADYAGLRIREYALLDSNVTREIILDTPVDAYSEVTI